MFIRDFNKTALYYNDRAVSYHDLLLLAGRSAELLACPPGERVVIFGENRPEWVYALYGAWLRGAVPVPVDVFASAAELAYILSDAQPAALFTSREKEPVVRDALARSGSAARVILFEDLPSDPAGPLPVFPEPAPGALAAILYTSGTTGDPKGVMLAFGNLAANVEAVTLGVPIFTPEDRVFAFLPFHHILPLMGTLVLPLSIGGSTVIAASLKPEELAAAMQARQVTIIIGVPRFWSLLRKGIRDKIAAAGPIPRLLFSLAARVRSRGLSRRLFKKVHARFGGRVKFLISGGAPLDTEVLRDFQTLGFELLEGYGMTEAAPMITFPRPGRVRNGACGQALPGEELRLVDGEITVRGPNVMLGYYRKPAETAETLRDGWLHTGDLGFLDSDGFLFITGRKKELLIPPNGKKISPFDIETRLLERAPELREAAVILKGDSLHLLAVPDEARCRTLEIHSIEEHLRWEVVDKYNRTAPPYRRLAGFTLLHEELPRTRLGKLKRHLLEPLADHGGQARPAPPDPPGEAYPLLRDFLRGEVEHPVRPDSHLEMDLALDSLGKLSLQVFLENTFGMAVEPGVLTDHPTVAELAAFIESHKTRAESEAVPWGDILRSGPAHSLPGGAWTLTAAQRLGRIAFHILLRTRSSGADRLPPGPFILAPNHQSYLDAFLVSAFLDSKTLRNTWFYGKEKHIHTRWQRALADRNNVIVVDVDRNLKESLQRMAAVLKSGKNLMIFPEGTRARDGQPGAFKRTFAILSRELNVPVVPVSIKGAFEALPPGARFPRPFTRVLVRFLPPVMPAELTVDEIRNKTREAVLRGIE
jgi:long-chain acyl-CoA synthetase